MMKRSTIIALVALAIVAATFGLIFLSMHDSAKTPPAPGIPRPAVPEASEAVPLAPPPVSTSPHAAASPRPAAAATLASGNSAPAVSTIAISNPSVVNPPMNHDSAMVDLGKAQRMIHDYHTLMGENPVGTNAEIMKSLMAGNARQATLAPLDGQTLNGKGELVDPWGTPYFFHQLSADVMEIHSAGPDKVMGTADDLNLK